jgi:hypothetical protein
VDDRLVSAQTIPADFGHLLRRDGVCDGVIAIAVRRSKGTQVKRPARTWHDMVRR